MIKLKSLITEYNFKMTKIDIQGNITLLYDLNSQQLLLLLKKKINKTFLNKFGFQIVNKIQFIDQPNKNKFRINIYCEKKEWDPSYKERVENAAEKLFKYINQLEIKSGLAKDQKKHVSRAEELAFVV